MAHIVMAHIVMAHIVMAYIVVAYMVMAYIVMAYIVTAHRNRPMPGTAPSSARRLRAARTASMRVGTRTDMRRGLR